MINDGDDASYESVLLVDDDIVDYDHDQYNSVTEQLQTDTLKGLNICDPYNPPPSITQWRTLAQLIGRNTYIEYFQFSNDGEDEEDFATEHLEAFISDIAKNRSLEVLLLDDHYFSSRTRLGLLHPFIIENNNLVKLRLSNCYFGTHDLQMLAAAFSQRRNPKSIKSLDISGRNISDESIPTIVDICGYCPRLQQLDLSYSRIGSQGLSMLATLLVNPESKLKGLCLAGIGGIDDEVARVLANSLMNNNKLKMLDLGVSRYSSITSIGWEYFVDILRHKTNINATSSSNHTLSSLWDLTMPSGLPMELRVCLQMNEVKNKKDVIREKIFHYHLKDTDLAPLFGADQEVLPDLLGWIGKPYEDGLSDKRSRSVFYAIVKSFPDLCSFETYDRKMRNQLEAENTIIKAEVAILKDENATIKAENVTLKAENEELLRKIEQLTIGK